MALHAHGSDRSAVVLYGSVRGLLAAVATPLALLALGLRSLSLAGPSFGSLGLIAGGVLVAATAALHLPRHVVFEPSGLTRVCVARRHRLDWDRIAALERTRPTMPSSPLRRSDVPERPRVTGGLVARGTGRRRWMLTDRVESREEYERLQALLAELPEPVRLRAPCPPEGSLPTGLYRRAVS